MGNAGGTDRQLTRPSRKPLAFAGASAISGWTGGDPNGHERDGEAERQPLPSPCPPGLLCPRLKVTQSHELSDRLPWERLSFSSLSPPPWDRWRQERGAGWGRGDPSPDSWSKPSHRGLGLWHLGAARSCNQSTGRDNGASLGMRTQSRRKQRAVPGAEVTHCAGL